MTGRLSRFYVILDEGYQISANRVSDTDNYSRVIADCFLGLVTVRVEQQI